MGATPFADAVRTPYRTQTRAFSTDWRFWMLVTFNSAALSYLWGLNSWLLNYLIKVRQFDPRQTGMYASMPFILMFFGEVLSAIISDRIGRRAVVCFFALFSAGICMYCVTVIADHETAAIMISVSAFFWGAALPSLFALGVADPSLWRGRRRGWHL
ncbi:MFS transporter [Bradyrhizobium sp. CIAT3101]|uniref:MFS transporter n=1 Tax=Bradyrhizobium sp. CIAT3101 TaxID=439387 RepID=UPI0024B0E90C|nr:MFS transporter [Bradyrhizobium sp. CIAT3101]WFU79208.1 MFS transporter [Bradyrhizobium sp. CIAT3101]